MRRNLFFLTAAALTLSLFSFGFLPKGKGWQQGVQVIGVRVRMPQPPEMQVRFEKRKGAGLLGKEESKAKDENMQGRLAIALKDFSVPKLIVEEFKFAFDHHTGWKIIPEEEFEKTCPDVIFDVRVVDYALEYRFGAKNNAAVSFAWVVEARRPGGEKPLWRVSKKKVSSSRNLKKWMLDRSDMIKGELRAHVLFSVQDLMNRTSIPRKRD